MNTKNIILLVIAVVIISMIFVMIKNRNHQPVAENLPKVLVATVDIPAGNFIRADKQLAWADWPKNSISPSFILPEAHKIDEFNGGMARNAIAAGTPIALSSVVRANEGGFMSAVLSPGKRAISVAVNQTSGNAGFIFPGDKVDLILTHKVSFGLASETFIEDLRVLAIDQMLSNPDNKAVVAKTVTLEVTPKQAEKINVAISLGAISLSLRSLASEEKSKESDREKDEGKYSTDSDVSKLMGDSNGTTVNVYHGTTAEKLDFQGSKK